MFLTFSGAAGQQIIHGKVQRGCQRVEQGDVGVAEPALPFAHRLVGDVQRLGQLLLGQALPLALFGHKSAEKLFVQSDHLTVIVVNMPKKATDRWFTAGFSDTYREKMRGKGGGACLNGEKAV